jgi:hypothetical protein
MGAIDVLTSSMKGYMGSSSPADKSCGSSTWAAAEERDIGRLGEKLAVQGATLAVCPHRSVYAAFPIATSERMIYHIIMLQHAARLGADVFAIDIACQFFRHLLARGRDNPGFADPLVRNLPVAAGTGEADTGATLRFTLSNDMAPRIIVTVRHRTVEAKGGALATEGDESASEGVAPTAGPIPDVDASDVHVEAEGGAPTALSLCTCGRCRTAVVQALTVQLRTLSGASGAHVRPVLALSSFPAHRPSS